MSTNVENLHDHEHTPRDNEMDYNLPIIKT
ncbi:MAG: hypothetical protein CM15mP69_0650 [Ectothiorhodospiraceae bacterium]|nr:MAG: hypothetical protein CM15mP69_0650 [Ectothiorhodospiraceae bacterium]